MFEENYQKIPLQPYLYTGLNLIDQFLILGYSNEEKSKDISKEIKDQFFRTKNISNDKMAMPPPQTAENNSNSKPIPDEVFIYNRKPTVISSINCKYNNSDLIDSSNVLEFIFPNNPKFYYIKNESNMTKEYYSRSYNVVFFLNNDIPNSNLKNITYGFGHVFYEAMRFPQLGVLFIPKVFCVLSKFPYFAHYLSLLKEIQNLVSNKSIPIEIILSNIVNYAPGPITCRINYVFYPESFYNNKAYSVNKMIIDKASGYPALDLNFGELFNVLPIEMIIKLFIFSFLEVDILLFSKKIEMLNYFMFLISTLNYPCNDTMYLWHIISVSKYELMNEQSENKFISKPFPTMLGVNNSYKETIDLSRFGKEVFIADLDKKTFFYKKTESNSEDDDGKNSLLSLINHISVIIDTKELPTNQFDLNIKLLHLKLRSIATKVLIFNRNREKDLIPKFFEINESIQQQNKQIQEIFYSFIINVIKPLYDCFSLSEIVKESNYSNRKSKEEYPISEKEHVINASNSPNEKTFYSLFSNTIKHSYYIKSFFYNYKALDCFQISLLFFEEFLNNHISVEDEYSLTHFDIIDSFYRTEGKDSLNVNVCNYDFLIKKNMQQGLLVCNNQFLRVFKEKHSHFNVQIELNTPVMYQYSNIVSNIELEHEQRIFPALKLLHELKSIVFSCEIIDTIQNYYIERKKLSTKDLLSFSTLLFSTLVSDVLKPAEFIKTLKVIFQILNRQTHFARKYIFILLSIYYHKAISLKELNQEYDHYLFAYRVMLNLVYLKNIYPSYELMKLIVKFSKIDHDSIDMQYAFIQFSELLLAQKQSENINLNKTETTQFDSRFCKSFDIINLSTSSDLSHFSNSTEIISTEYQLFLTKNQCRDETKKKAQIYRSIENESYEGDIILKCETCRKTITPILRYKAQSKIHEVNIFSPLKLFNMCTYMMLNWLLKKLSSAALNYDDLKSIMINLHFYQTKIDLNNPIIFVKKLLG